MFRYRLAPEARFPDQYNEAVQASKHILTAEVLSLYSIDPKRVAVSGDSAGANLAAAVAQQVWEITANQFHYICWMMSNTVNYVFPIYFELLIPKIVPVLV